MAETDLRAKIEALHGYEPDSYLYPGGVPGPAFMRLQAGGEWVKRADVSAALAAVQQESYEKWLLWIRHLSSCEAYARSNGKCSCGLSEHLKAQSAPKERF